MLYLHRLIIHVAINNAYSANEVHSRWEREGEARGRVEAHADLCDRFADFPGDPTPPTLRVRIHSFVVSLYPRAFLSPSTHNDSLLPHRSTLFPSPPLSLSRISKLLLWLLRSGALTSAVLVRLRRRRRWKRWLRGTEKLIISDTNLSGLLVGRARRTEKPWQPITTPCNPRAHETVLHPPAWLTLSRAIPKSLPSLIHQSKSFTAICLYPNIGN